MFKQVANILTSARAKLAAAAVACLLSAMLSAWAVPAALAAPADTGSASGSISLNCSYTRYGVTTYLVGDKYALTKVADLTIDPAGVYEYRILPAFADYDIAWPQLTSSELWRHSKVLGEFAAQQQYYDDYAFADQNGKLTFTGLDLGLYLISRVEIADANADFSLNSFIVSIPYTAAGETIYQAEVKPKFARGLDSDDPDDPNNPDDPDDPDSPGPAPAESSNTPQTPGQGNPSAPPKTGDSPTVGLVAAALAVVSAIVWLLAARHARRTLREED